MVNPKLRAIFHKNEVFDKWKILIHHDKDRQTFEGALVNLGEDYYSAGIVEGVERERKEQERIKSSTILPLEKKNDTQR